MAAHSVRHRQAAATCTTINVRQPYARPRLAVWRPGMDARIGRNSQCRSRNALIIKCLPTVILAEGLQYILAVPTEPTLGGERSFRFGPFELSEREGELRRNGTRIKLQEQPLRVLLELVASSGKVVTREELKQRLWLADTFVDFDTGLNTAIRKLRQALNDDADAPRYIETLAKRGYKFVAPVADSAAAAQTTGKHSLPGTPISLPSDGTKSATSDEIQRKPRWYWALTACVLVLVSYGALIAWRIANTPRPLKIEQQITANPPEARITAAVVSPDGKYVAYSDTTGLYIRHINSGEVRPLQLPKRFNAIPTSWFPDGSNLLLTSWDSSPGNPSLWKVSILGGSPQKVMDDANDGAISPDGSKIAFLRATYPYTQEIWVVESDGSNARRVVQASSGSGISSVAWSPNGRRLAYMRVVGFGYLVGNKYSLETADLSGGTPTVLKTSAQLVPTLCWAPDRRLLYAYRDDPASERWNSGIWSVRVNEKSGKLESGPQELTRGVGQIRGLSITADGKRLVLWRANSQPGVFLTEIDPATGRFKQPRRFTLDENGNVATAWTPDSTAILFASNRNGTWKLFRQAIDQVTPEVLVEGRSNFLPRLSPDGKHMLYVNLQNPENPAQPASLMQVPLQGGSPRVVLRMPSMGNIQCARTPSRLCLFLTLEGSMAHFFSFNPEVGTAQEFTAIHVTEEPSWNLSPDGSQLALILSARERKVTFMSVDNKSTHEVELNPWSPRSLDWAADSKSVFVTSRTANGVSVILGVEPNGNHRVLLEGASASQYWWVIPSPDGRYGALEAVTGENNVWMLENF